jgi:thiol:disulfide interchange protein DsbA
VATGNDGITVTEFFSYACIHCFEFDPAVEAWKEQAGPDVTFERVPAVFSRSWALLAQAYYVARACEVLPATHTPFFRAIHLERRPIRSAEDIAGFYASAVAEAEYDEGRCTSAEDFSKVFESFGVTSAVQQAMARGRAYQASGVPTMIVDGRWRVDGRSAGSNEGMLDVVDFLVRRLRAEDGAEARASAPADAATAGD